MPSKHLEIYLNNHLGGAVAALELLSYVAGVFKDADTEGVAKALHQEVEADKRSLEDLMKRLNISLSLTQRASGWIGEKFAQLKLLLDDPAGQSFRLFEASEALYLGIEGKKQMWLAMATAAETSPDLRMLDYQNLIERAEAQQKAIQTVRLQAARSSFTA